MWMDAILVVITVLKVVEDEIYSWNAEASLQGMFLGYFVVEIVSKPLDYFDG